MGAADLFFEDTPDRLIGDGVRETLPADALIQSVVLAVYAVDPATGMEEAFYYRDPATHPGKQDGVAMHLYRAMRLLADEDLTDVAFPVGVTLEDDDDEDDE